MLSRMLFGLVLGLIMYMPRPGRPEGLPSGPPPFGPDEPPIDIDPPGDIEKLPMPLPGPDGGRFPPRHPSPGFPGKGPSVPPTPPPGYEGDWPPASELPELPGRPGRPEAPPTPPPGHEGPWPGERRSLLERILDLLRELNSRDQHYTPSDRIKLYDAQDGAKHLAASDGDEKRLA